MERFVEETIHHVSQDDLEIIEITLGGVSEAFGELVEKYQERLYNSIVHLFGPRDAEDVVQETFIKAFQKLQTFRGTSSFYSWIYRIGFNTAVSHRRRLDRTLPPTSLDGLEEAVGSQFPDHEKRPDEVLEEKDRARQLQNALNALSETHRTILILREVELLSYEGIADVLSIRVGTIRSRLHRARVCLKEELNRVMRHDLE